MLQPTLNTSCRAVLNYMNGNQKTIPGTAKCIVDVRDCAKAHINAMASELTSGRVLLIGACQPWADIVKEIKKVEPTAQTPTNVANGKSTFKMVPPFVRFSCQKAEVKLNLKFTPWQDSLAATIRSLKAQG